MFHVHPWLHRDATTLVGTALYPDRSEVAEPFDNRSVGHSDGDIHLFITATAVNGNFVKKEGCAVERAEGMIAEGTASLGAEGTTRSAAIARS